MVASYSGDQQKLKRVMSNNSLLGIGGGDSDSLYSQTTRNTNVYHPLHPVNSSSDILSQNMMQIPVHG